MVTFPYKTTDFAFTLNPVFINFSSNNNAYFDVEISIKYFNFYSQIQQTKVINYKIPLFNGVAKWYVGAIIHRNLADLKVPFAAGFQTKTALVTFTVLEKQLADDQVISAQTLVDVKFIAGNLPNLIANNIALLHTNKELCRVTQKGYCNVSFLLSAGEHVLKIFLNENQVSAETITATASNAVFTKQVSIASLNANLSDSVIIKIEGTSIQKTFVVFPSTNQSNTLYFIDNHKLLTSLELTGEFLFQEDYKQLTHDYKRNLEEVLEIVDVEEENILKINTGYILKAQDKLINELFKCKKAFIKNINGYDLQIVPISKKRVGYDSTAFLYDYDLEFRINKKTDA